MDKLKRQLYNRYYYEKTRAKKKKFESYEDYRKQLASIQTKEGESEGGVMSDGD